MMHWCGDSVAPASELNFPEVENIRKAEFLGPAFWVMARVEELKHRRAYLSMSICQANDAAMAKFCEAHLKLV
jgi:hypothetical protein